jgi:hypothetical protein
MCVHLFQQKKNKLLMIIFFNFDFRISRNKSFSFKNFRIEINNNNSAIIITEKLFLLLKKKKERSNL